MRRNDQQDLVIARRRLSDLSKQLVHSRVQAFVGSDTHLLDLHQLEFLGEPLLFLVRQQTFRHLEENVIFFCDVLTQKVRVFRGGLRPSPA